VGALVAPSPLQVVRDHAASARAALDAAKAELRGILAAEREEHARELAAVRDEQRHELANLRAEVDALRESLVSMRADECRRTELRTRRGIELLGALDQARARVRDLLAVDATESSGDTSSRPAGVVGEAGAAAKADAQPSVRV